MDFILVTNQFLHTVGVKRKIRDSIVVRIAPERLKYNNLSVYIKYFVEVKKIIEVVSAKYPLTDHAVHIYDSGMYYDMVFEVSQRAITLPPHH